MNKLFRVMRGVLGLYTIDSAERAGFDPTILQHYERLRSDFLLLCPPAEAAAGANAPVLSADAACQRAAYDRGTDLIQHLDQNREGTTNADLYTLECAVIALSSLEALKQGYQSLQNRYRALAGAEVYKEYLIGQRPPVTQKTVVPLGDKQADAGAEVAAPNTDVEIYRADSLFLVREIRRYSILVPRREQIRRWLLLDVLAITLFLLAIFIASIVTHQPPGGGFPVMRLVAIAAMLGGVTSVLQRIQTIPEDQVILSLWNRISVVLGPLTAIVFAMVLYEVFEAGFLNGTFFPDLNKLYCPTCDGSFAPHGHGLVINTVSSLELGKLIVWSFIAGFSERLVPDTLNGLIERQKTATSK